MMTFDQFSQLREHACTLHASQQGASVVGLDAIFAAVAAHALHTASEPRRKPGRPPVERVEPPAWFGEAVERLKGQRLTASTFAMLAGRGPVSQEDTRNIGRWLRDIGKPPRKIGGQNLFQL